MMTGPDLSFSQKGISFLGSSRDDAGSGVEWISSNGHKASQNLVSFVDHLWTWIPFLLEVVCRGPGVLHRTTENREWHTYELDGDDKTRITSAL